MEGDEIDKERGVIVEEDRQRGKRTGTDEQAAITCIIERLPLCQPHTYRENRYLNTFTYIKSGTFTQDCTGQTLQAVIAVGDFDGMR